MNFERLTYLDSLLAEEVKQGRVFGCAVTLGNRGGRLYTAAAGDIKPDTLCMLCSMTKPVTSVAAWILIERGVIDPMDDISDYLPGFRAPKVLNGGLLEPAKRGILIRDLFNMTSGVTYGLGTGAVKGTPAWQMQQISLAWRKRIDAGEKLSNVDMVNELGQVPLIYQPGDHWDYGKSADILAAIVEAASGMTFGQFLQKEIFDPLEMNGSGFVFPEERASQAARIAKENPDGTVQEITAGEFYGDGLALHQKPYMENGGGGVSPVMGRGLYSTLDDYAKFAAMLLCGGAYSGKQILSPRTVRQFSQDHLTPEQSRTMWPWLAGYGYGNLMRVMVNPALAYTAGCAGEFGWDGTLGTYFFVDPEADLYLVYMQQRAGGAIRRRIRNIAYSAL